MLSMIIRRNTRNYVRKRDTKRRSYKKKGLSRMKLPEIKEELKKRGIEFKQNDKKKNLLERLEFFLLNPDRVNEYQPEAEKREIETQTEPYTYGPPPPLPPPPSDVFLRKYNEDRAQDKKEEYYRLRQAAEDFERDEEEEEEEARDDDFSSSGLEGFKPI